MVRVWYKDDDDVTDQKAPHMRDQNSFLDVEELKKETGVEYFKFEADTLDQNEEYAKLRNDRGYSYEDTVDISRETLPNYDQTLKMFYTEHIHEHEEIRFIQAGSGYFEVRNAEDKWLRVEVEQGDLIIMPAGIYHRFTLDTNNYLKARRLFKGSPIWTPIYRPADDHPSRKEYLKRFGQACSQGHGTCQVSK